MKRFYATHIRDEEKGKPASLVVGVISWVKDGERWKENKMHRRPDYTMTEAEHTARWLNEREAGYPVRANLEHLYGSQRVAKIKDRRRSFERVARRKAARGK